MSDPVTTIAGTLEHLDPHTLVIGDNVREFANLDKPFCDSIAEHGVIVPITAIRRPDGVVEVRNGQRRTAAARTADLSTVPVYVMTTTAADPDAEAIERITHQIVTNDQKRDLSDAQRARGIQQMIDAGLTAQKVAKRLSVSKETVTAAQRAAMSNVALEALEARQLSMTEAAALTEFEQDGPDAIGRLVDAAGTPRFDHLVSQLRAERVSAEAQAKAAADHTARGFTVLYETPTGWDPACVPLRHLVTADGDIADEQAVTDPSHWAVLLYEDTALVDTETGEPVEEQTVDWDTEGAPDAIPADGMRHADSVTEATIYVPEYFCLDPASAALTPSGLFARNAGRNDGNEPQTPTDLDAAAERAEADRRERRKVIALNKLGEAASRVRREFITTLLTRKTLPKGAATFVADCIARDSYMLTQHNRDQLTAELLGVDAATVHTTVSALPTGSDNRALVIALALVLGSLEGRAGKDMWRNPSPVREPGDDRIYYGHQVSTGDLLRFLAGQGYTLSAVEEVVTGSRTADAVYDEYLTESGKQ